MTKSPLFQTIEIDLAAPLSCTPALAMHLAET